MSRSSAGPHRGREYAATSVGDRECSGEDRLLAVRPGEHIHTAKLCRADAKRRGSPWEAELRCKRILALAPVLPLLLAAGASTSSNDNGSTNKTDIVIAASLELTGAQAETGKVYENALRLKVEQINAGRAADQPKVTLRISDNRSDPGTATAQLGEITSDPTVTAVITGASSECLV